MKMSLPLWVALALTPAVLSAQPVDRAELQALRAQVQQLEQQLKTLSHQLEVREAAADAAAAAPTPPPAKATVTDRGYSLASADAANRIRFGALLHFDSRVFFDDGGGIVNTTFLLRRVRPFIEGTLAKHFSYQFVPEFGGSTVTILDANLTTDLTDSLQLKAGKFKTPLGLEVLQSDAATSFTERSMLSTLLPGRDLGVQLGTTLAGGRVVWTAGIFNGVADGATSTNSDFDEDKDVVSRLMVAPLRGVAGSPLRGLAFGIAASEGRQKTSAGRTAGYRTDGQQVFFAYNPGVVADGRIWRVSPQVDYRYGHFGVMGEYVVTGANLRSSFAGVKREVQHKGWHVSTVYMLTGEESSYGQVVPRTDFNPAAGTWGGFAVAARFTDVKLDDAAFPVLASPATSANGARSWAAGVNWFLSKAVEFKFDYYHTTFGFSRLAPPVSAAPVLRQPEKVFISRFQVGF